MSIGRRYVLPLGLGFGGMFICHFGLFLCFQAGVGFIAYVIVYPVVYPLLAVILTVSRPGFWLSNAIFLCAVPLTYWYFVLARDAQLDLRSPNLYDSSGMSIVMLLTLGLTTLSAFTVSRIMR